MGKNYLNRSIIYLWILVILLITLACGGSTAQQLASAVPSKPSSSQIATSSISNENTQISQPTNTAQNSKPVQSPSPQPESIQLISQGAGQNDRELGYGFIVKNPNLNYAYDTSQYQIAVYNAEGTVIKTDSGYIALMLPGQQLGVGGTMYLDEGMTAAKIEVQLNDGMATVSDLSNTFTVDKVFYKSDKNFPHVRGVITNPYNKDITDLRISAVLYDDAGNIIGGGYTFLNFIQSNNSTGVDFSVASNGNVSRVELFPTLSGLSDLGATDQLPQGASDLSIVKQGYGQNKSELSFGIVIENSNQDLSFESSMYHVTAYSEDGSVLGVSEGYIDLMLPNQALGVVDNIYLDDGVIVSRIDAQIKQGSFNQSASIPVFSSENAAYLSDQYFPKITGQIISPYDKDITNLRVSAIAYNAAGDIIGGGFTYLDFVPANSKAAVEVNITVSDTPVKVELYASVSALSDIED
jgi:hypothetical protein